MLKELLLPPGSLILAALALGFLLRRRRGAIRAVLLLSMAFLYLLSTPFVSGLLLRSLQWYPPIVPGDVRPDETAAAEAIIVLAAGRDRRLPMYGGDTVDALSLERIRFAARLARATRLPVLVSGGPPPSQADMPSMAMLMAEALAQDFGVETRWREDASLNTAENARFSARMLAGVPVRKVYLVTHAWHLPRAMLAFRATGLDAVPAAASHAHPERLRAASLMPTARALANTAYAVHEWLGLGWYAVAHGLWQGR